MGNTGELAEPLRRAGLRVTQPRLAVLAALDAAPHADADTIIRIVRDKTGGVSTQAVYDVLHALAQAGLARRIEPAGSPARYELRVVDNHHHLVCRGCQRVVDVDCALGVRPSLTPQDTHGFALDEAEVTYSGLCPDCAAQQPKAPCGVPEEEDARSVHPTRKE